MVNGILGTKMKVIQGYPGGTEINLAMERGEVQGRCGWGWSTLKAQVPTWLQEKKINVLIQTALQKHPDLPNVPLILDLAKTDEQRQILRLVFARSSMGRPYLAPPGTPQEPLSILRTAFSATLKDQRFLDAARPAGLAVYAPLDGEALSRLVSQLAHTPPAVVKRARDMLAM